ncbi:hypothetical protein P171DRAFT_436222 [Karstenula rhodostoma CBS 690.94]|uniref:Uncharacterized protein n=1 Tax=Karstenula rhodostoma CBS 690.94 TaxID=1392251 RepID=A0A9P4PAE4_9PLEO|nr:hypothetical protein P171DRAFT_436222 [Karstenula rhodostoma CBS 690.94]
MRNSPVATHSPSSPLRYATPSPQPQSLSQSHCINPHTHSNHTRTTRAPPHTSPPSPTHPLPAQQARAHVAVRRTALLRRSPRSE